MTWKDCNKLQRAAIFWAYYRKYKVKTKIWPCGDDLYYIRVTLVAKYRVRDYS